MVDLTKSFGLEIYAPTDAVLAKDERTCLVQDTRRHRAESMLQGPWPAMLEPPAPGISSRKSTDSSVYKKKS